MPRLVVFAACDRILIEESGIASLISIIDEFTLTIKGDTKIGRDAVGPTQWAIYTKWEKTSGDDDKEFVQIIQALWPDESEFKRIKAPFRFQPDKKAHQNRIEILMSVVYMIRDVVRTFYPVSMITVARRSGEASYFAYECSRIKL